MFAAAISKKETWMFKLHGRSIPSSPNARPLSRRCRWDSRTVFTFFLKIFLTVFGNRSQAAHYAGSCSRRKPISDLAGERETHSFEKRSRLCDARQNPRGR